MIGKVMESYHHEINGFVMENHHIVFGDGPP